MFDFFTTLLFWMAPELAGRWIVRTYERGVRDAEHTPSAPRKAGFEDPVYQKNLQRLIERNRQFENSKE
jgi:hypothetical protein